MAASTSGAKTPTVAPYAGNDGDDEDLAALFTSQQEELLAARIAHSDSNMAFNLQMNEAITFSASLSSTSAAAITTTSEFAETDTDFAAALDLLADEIDRLEANLQLSKAEIRRIRDNLGIRMHDREVAWEIFGIPQQDWEATGGHYERPYAIQSEDSSSLVEYFKLYFKGMVVQDPSGAKLGAIGVMILDSADAVILELSKPLVLPEALMREDVAELEAFVHGLELALSLKLSPLFFCSVYFNVAPYFLLSFESYHTPKEAKVAELVDNAAVLMKRFAGCHFSSGTEIIAEIVSELAISSIGNQTSRPVKRHCQVCLEEIGAGPTYNVFRCFSCERKSYEPSLRIRIPSASRFKHNFQSTMTACLGTLGPDMCDRVHEVHKEIYMPASERVYCPNPRCLNLMSKAEALATIQAVEETSREELTMCKCVKCDLLFCINCKVLWHSSMSCDDFKKQNLDSSSPDAKLKMLALNEE